MRPAASIAAAPAAVLLAYLAVQAVYGAYSTLAGAVNVEPVGFISGSPNENVVTYAATISSPRGTACTLGPDRVIVLNFAPAALEASWSDVGGVFGNLESFEIAIYNFDTGQLMLQLDMYNFRDRTLLNGDVRTRLCISWVDADFTARYTVYFTVRYRLSR